MEQYKTGLVQTVNASPTIIGTASCDWLNQIAAGHVFKTADDQISYTIATVLTATRLVLSANYAGTGGTGLSYIACRSFSSNRGYWRILNGDDDWADLMSQQTIDKIDTDMQTALSGGVQVDVSAANYAASPGYVLMVDSLTTIPTITLPASPTSSRNFVEIRDVTGHFNGSSPTVLGNGNNINGVNASIVLDRDWMTARFTYVNPTIGYHVE